MKNETSGTVTSLIRQVSTEFSLNCYRYLCMGNIYDGERLWNAITNETNKSEGFLNNKGNIFIVRDGEKCQVPYIRRLNEFTHDAKNEFIEGFMDTMPRLYNHAVDCNQEQVFCMPWLGDWNSKEFMEYGMTPYEMGCAWTKKILPDWVKYMKSELDSYLK